MKVEQIMELNPITTTNHIRDSYLRYLQTIKPFQDEWLRTQFVQAISEPEMLVKGLRKKGIDVFVIAKGNENDEAEKILRIPTQNLSYFRRFLFIKPATNMLCNLHKRLKFDLVHFNEPHIIFRKLDLPTLCTFHSTQSNEFRLKLYDVKHLKTVKDIQDLLFKSSVGSICDIYSRLTPIDG